MLYPRNHLRLCPRCLLFDDKALRNWILLLVLHALSATSSKTPPKDRRAPEEEDQQEQTPPNFGIVRGRQEDPTSRDHDIEPRSPANSARSVAIWASSIRARSSAALCVS